MGLFFVWLMAPVNAPVLAAEEPNDPFFNEQWYLERIAAPEAWETSKGSEDLVIAVLDTGIDLDHPDLKDRLWRNGGEIANNGLDDDDNGYVDDVQGWDFVTNDNSPAVDLRLVTDPDAASHGTLVAGLIAAETDNNAGFAGVTWEGQLMPLRMLDETGVGGEQDAAAAIDYAVENGAQVINMSFAGDNAGTLLKAAAQRAYNAGVVIVAALGNGANNVNVTPVYPACITLNGLDGIIGVTGVDQADNGSEFSNYGDDCADLAAPGEDILGLGYFDIEEGFANPYSGPWAGTSTAAPLVTGAVGILLSAYPDLTPDDIATILKLAVDPIRSAVGMTGSYGVGRLNIARALEMAAGFSGAEPGTPPEDEKPAVPDEGQEFPNDHYSFVALGAPAGERPDVRVYRADGIEYATFTAYTLNFSGGVRTALADFDFDGIPEVVTAAGETGGPHIRVFKPFGAVISEFFAYSKDSSHGVNIAVGDIDADGVQEIVTSVGQGVSNDVVIWSQAGLEQARFTVEGFAPNAPLSVAVADVDDDWEGEIIVWSTVGDSRVAIYQHNGQLLNSFLADPQPKTGMDISTGDFNADFRQEILVSLPTSDGAIFRLYNSIGAFVNGFNLLQPSLTKGAEVVVTDIDIDDVPDVVIAPRGAAGEVRVLDQNGVTKSVVGSGLVGPRGAYLGAW